MENTSKQVEKNNTCRYNLLFRFFVWRHFYFNQYKHGKIRQFFSERNVILKLKIIILSPKYFKYCYPCLHITQ